MKLNSVVTFKVAVVAVLLLAVVVLVEDAVEDDDALVAVAEDASDDASADVVYSLLRRSSPCKAPSFTKCSGPIAPMKQMI